MNMPQDATDGGAIQRLELTAEEFARQYDRPAKPVVLANVIRQWPATSQWTPEFFRARYGELRLPVIFPDGRQVELPLSEFLDHVAASTPDEPGPYLYGIMFEQHMPELLPAIRPAPGTGPAFLNTRLLPQLRRFRDGRPELLIASPGANFLLHYDDLHVHTYVTQVRGDKIFWMYPPEQTPYMYPRPDQRNVSQIDRVEPLDEQRFPLFRTARPLQALVREGDSIYIPAGWWHHTRTLSASIAIRHEAATPSNWEEFCNDYVLGSRVRNPLTPWRQAKLGYMRGVGRLLGAIRPLT
jgi:hypothetical protein